MIDSASPLLFYLITGLPIAGLALMALFLFSLSTKKDRFIIPATVIIFLALTGWGIALEYGHLLKKPDRQKPQVRQVAQTEPAAYEEETVYIDEEPEKRTEPQRKERDRGGTDRLIPAPHRRKMIRKDSRDNSGTSRRRIVRKRPAPSSGQTKESTTSRREQPAPEPEPEPETRQPKPSRTTEPAPTPGPSREPPPPRTPSPPARSGSANLAVKIRGPIVETSKEPRRNAHINIILDGKHVRTVRPSRTKEDKNSNTGEVTAITYFWENVSVSFKNLDPGWHIVQIDTSLENPSSHRAAMLSPSGQVNNDYNGQINLEAGRTNTMVFTTKNWNTGQLIRSR